MKKITLSDGSSYPPIPDLCHCSKHCNEIVYGGKEFINNHHPKRKLLSPYDLEIRQKQKERKLRKKRLKSLKAYPIFDLCHCNCGEIVYGGKRFINYHQNRGKNNSMYDIHLIREDNPFFNCKHSELTKQKMSENHWDCSGVNNPMYNVHILGDKHHSWKGGITPLHLSIRHSSKYLLWRVSVFERDEYICQDCGQKGGNLEAHHIKEFATILQENNIISLEQAILCEELWNLSNGKTLCVQCHEKTY